MQNWTGRKLGHIKADPFLGAAETWVSDADRPATGPGITKLAGRTVGIGNRPFTAQIIQTVSLPVPLVTKASGEPAIIKMGSTLTVFVDKAAIGEFRPVFVIKTGHPVEGQVMDNSREQVIWIWRTAR